MHKVVLDFSTKSRSQRRGEEECRFCRRKKKTRDCEIVVRLTRESGQSIGNVMRKYRICKTMEK